MASRREAIIALCALALTVASGLAPAAPQGEGSPTSVAVADDVASPPPPSVAIDPDSWWLESGENVSLRATWVGTPAGCSLGPIWFRWAVASGGSEGILNTTNGSETTFVAPGQATGSTVVTVRSAATLECEGNVSPTISRATAQIAVVAPLAISPASFAVNPTAPGSSDELTGMLVGGAPPYELRVAWGDGNVSVTTVRAPGTFAVAHTYEVAGSFAPAVLATDTAGRSASPPATAPLVVSSVFAAAIVPSTPVTDVGAPVLFNISTVAAPSNFSWVFACEDGLAEGAVNATGALQSCAFAAPGAASISFTAVGVEPPFPAASASLDETVVARPSLQLPPLEFEAEVGGTVYAPLELSGGVPPFALSWSLVGTGAVGSATVTSDGTTYLPLSSARAGTLQLSVVVVDTLGDSASATELLDVRPPLQLWASVASEATSHGIAVNVSASVLDGSPPFDWAVVPDNAATNATAGAGTLDASGSIAWNATYRTEGALNLTVVLVDTAGAWATVNLTVPLVPRVVLSEASVVPEGPGRLVLTGIVSGGLRPFAYRWTDCAGDAWNASSTLPGLFELNETTNATGRCSFALVVVDALGFSASASVVEDLPARTPAPSAGPAFGTAAVAVAMLAATVTVALFLRRRRPPALAPPPDPVAVLRETIEPSDGVDRGLVELLAEERGVPLDVVRATLERLKAEGKVRAGRGADGEEVLAWSAHDDR